MSRRMLALALAAASLAPPALGQELIPRFEVATLKVSPPPAGASIGINLGTFRNGRFTFGNVTLEEAVLFAFDLPSKELLVSLNWQEELKQRVPTRCFNS